ncbi:MAG: single-stranded-DNA-specific exonuclease RecJ [Oscillospiraceae bacterium]
MLRRWKTKQSFVPADSAIIEQCGPLAGRILLQRGITSVEELACNSLPDPFLMKDMDKAAEVISDALEQDKKIVIFGDYDCDGVCAAAILYSYLEAQGADVDYYIPDRLKEGYGMNMEAVKKLVSRGTELVITVDNGISAHNEARFLKENGVGLVITDHHQPSETLPECDACVDPHRGDDASGCDCLCGAGVVLMLLVALEGDEEFILDRYSDLAAAATVADVVSLKGENRLIVRRGLENIRNEQNAGLTKLIKAAKRDTSTISSTDLAFYVVPKINAAGRLSSAETALELLLCEDDVERAATLTEQLMEFNAERQKVGDDILAEAQRMIAENPLIAKQRVIILAKQGWHPGVIGIVCSKLLEEYGKPVVLIAIGANGACGSVRSIEGFSVYSMLNACSQVLTKFGGHPGAGGFSLPADRISEFTELAHEYCLKTCPKMPEYSLYADMELSADALTVENVELLKVLEPFGEGNSLPLFRISNCTVSSKAPRGEDGKYTAFRITSRGLSIPVISFNVRYADFYPNDGDMIDIIASAEINEYNGRKSVQLRLVDYRMSGFEEDKFFAAMRVYEGICRGEGCDKRLLPRVLPQNREELIPVFDLLKRGQGRTPEQLFSMDGRVNYCKLRVALDAFADAGLIRFTENGAVECVPTTGRQDLFAEGSYLDRLRKSLDTAVQLA